MTNDHSLNDRPPRIHPGETAGCSGNDSAPPGDPASPPCSMHEVDPAYMGLDALEGELPVGEAEPAPDN